LTSEPIPQHVRDLAEGNFTPAVFWTNIPMSEDQVYCIVIDNVNDYQVLKTSKYGYHFLFKVKFKQGFDNIFDKDHWFRLNIPLISFSKEWYSFPNARKLSQSKKKLGCTIFFKKMPTGGETPKGIFKIMSRTYTEQEVNYDD